MKAALNIIIYQAIWFLAVYWGNRGGAIGLVLLVLHLVITPSRKEDLRLMGFTLFLGIVVDSTLQQSGLFTLEGEGIGIPYWLMVIWLGFGITPNHSLRWLQERILLSVFLGCIGGPAAYYGGSQLGAATFHYPLSVSIIVLALVWGLVFPAIMLYSKKGRLASGDITP